MVYKARQLDLRQNMVSRQAILIYVALFSGTIVTYRHSWWFAAGSLILAMLTDPDSPNDTVSRRTHAEPVPSAQPDKDPERWTDWGHPPQEQPSLPPHVGNRSTPARLETQDRSPASS
jgi:hypothetical protein